MGRDRERRAQERPFPPLSPLETSRDGEDVVGTLSPSLLLALLSGRTYSAHSLSLSLLLACTQPKDSRHCLRARVRTGPLSPCLCFSHGGCPLPRSLERPLSFSRQDWGCRGFTPYARTCAPDSCGERKLHACLRLMERCRHTHPSATGLGSAINEGSNKRSTKATWENDKNNI